MGKRAAWRLVDRDENTLPPLVYSTRKTQEDVVNEALEALDDHDVVFLMGGVGTGKSAIALHLLDYYGKGIISTPTKILEKQYKDDYCGPGGMRLKNPDGGILDVNILMGRTNFACPNPSSMLRKPVHCGDRRLPCVRRLSEGITRCAVATARAIEGSHGSYYQYDDKKYFYLETTGEGWRIGEIPPDFTETIARIHPLHP